MSKRFGINKNQLNDIADPSTPSRLSAAGRQVVLSPTEGGFRAESHKGNVALRGTDGEFQGRPGGPYPSTASAERASGYFKGAKSASVYDNSVTSSNISPATKQIADAEAVNYATQPSAMFPDKVANQVDPGIRNLEEAAGIVPKRKKFGY